MYKIVEDPVQNGSSVISEVTELISELWDAVYWLYPTNSQVARREGGPAKYVVASRTALSRSVFSGIEARYPCTFGLVMDGRISDAGAPRLTDAIYKLGNAVQEMKRLKCLIKSDADRASLRDLISQAIGDLVVFLIIQFKLYDQETEVYMAVANYASGKDVSPDVVYGELLDWLATTKQSVYGFEICSRYYTKLQEMDAVFLAECEEYFFPLTDDLCEGLVSGNLLISDVRSQLTAFKKGSIEEEDEKITPDNIIKRMQLD